MDPWFRRRRYLHFDLPIGPRRARSIVTDPKQVERHAFYPFIYSVITTVKTSRNPKTKKIERKKKAREISYSAHVDSHIYSYYSWKLSEAYEQKLIDLGLSRCVLAFRSLGKSNIDFAWYAFREISKRGNCDVVAFDIKGFFDNLDHAILKRAWANVLGKTSLPADHHAVFKSLTRWSRIDKLKLFHTLGISIHNPNPIGANRRRLCCPQQFRDSVRKPGLIEPNPADHGIPQGSPISAVLSNIYMLPFDQRMLEFSQSIGATYLRYCDDIIVIAPAGLASKVKAFVEKQVSDVKLEVQPEKTEQCTFSVGQTGGINSDRPLQYLGFTFDGRRIRIRSTSLMRYFERMRQGVKVAKKGTAKRNKLRLARGEAEKPLHRKKLFRRYSYLGRRNFLSYGLRSADEMASDSLMRQLRPLWGKLRRAIDS
jgi:hypothetical protein